MNSAKPPKFRDVIRAKRASIEERHEAVDAVRVRSAGRSVQEIRGDLIDEMASRGQTRPPDPVLDYLAESVALSGNPRYATLMAPKAVRVLSALGSELGKIRKLLNGVTKLAGPNGEEPYFVPPGVAPAEFEVILDSGAAQVLRTWPDGGDEVRTARLVPVWLARSESIDPDAPVTVNVGRHRVGVLSPEDGLTLRATLADAQRMHRTLMMFGAYTRQPADDAPRLRLFPYGPDVR